MANTTNYNWETPDDTDLVKDGAAAIRTLGSSVDTTTKALNPSTTLGDIEYRSATANTNTRLGIGSSGQVLTVAGGVPTWATSDDANAIQNAIVDAKGDIVAASAADTPARLAVGTDNQRLVAASGEATGLKYVSDTQNTVVDAAGDLVYGTAADTLGRLAIGTAGQVLKVNSGATAPEWATASAGALTKITSGSGTSVASITVDNAFTSTYKNYILQINAIGTASDNFILTLRTSGSDITTTNYNHQQLLASSTSVSGASSTSQSRWIIGNVETVRVGMQITIWNPQENVATTFFSNNADNNDSATSPRIIMRSGNFSGTNQFDGFKIAYASGVNFDANVVVYGLEK
jgi:hypothetical protein